MSDLLGLLLAQMRRNGHDNGTTRNYLNVCRCYIAYSGKSALTIKEGFTRERLLSYQDYFEQNGCCKNTIGAYNRILRAMFNKAVKLRMIAPNPALFEGVFTGCEPTDKRALSMEDIARLFKLDLSKPTLEKLRKSCDWMVLMFLCHGMSFADLARLKKSDVKNGYITYRRQKSGAPLTVKLLAKAKEIIARYRGHDDKSPYLLPILDYKREDIDTACRSALKKFNRHLKELGVLAKINSVLTSYVIRHSWATAAYHTGIATALISDAMGHKTEEVTRIYLLRHDAEVIGQANQMVWDALFGKMEKGKRKGKGTGSPDSGNVSLLARVGHNLDAKERISSETSKSL